MPDQRSQMYHECARSNAAIRGLLEISHKTTRSRFLLPVSEVGDFPRSTDHPRRARGDRAAGGLTHFLPLAEPLFSPSCAPTWKSNSLAVAPFGVTEWMESGALLAAGACDTSAPRGQARRCPDAAGVRDKKVKVPPDQAGTGLFERSGRGEAALPSNPKLP